MTTWDKRKALEEFCNKRDDCSGCPLEFSPVMGCYGQFTSDPEAEFNYGLVFNEEGKADDPSQTHTEYANP